MLWTKRSSGIDNRLSEIVINGKQIVTVGAQGKILSSTDGIYWAIRQRVDKCTVFSDIICCGKKYFAFGSYFTGDMIDNGCISIGQQSVYTSIDGIMWTNELQPGASCPAQAISNGTQFAGIKGNCIYSSTDGINWKVQDSIAADSWNALAWEKQIFIAVSIYGKVAFSSDGVTWNYQSSNLPYEAVGFIYADSQFVAVAGNSIFTLPPFSKIRWKPSARSSKNIAYCKSAGNSIEYNIPTSSSVILNLYCIDGRLLKTLVNRFQSAGTYQCAIPSDLVAGKYVFKLKTNNGIFNNHILINK